MCKTLEDLARLAWSFAALDLAPREFTRHPNRFQGSLLDTDIQQNAHSIRTQTFRCGTWAETICIIYCIYIYIPGSRLKISARASWPPQDQAVHPGRSRHLAGGLSSTTALNLHTLYVSSTSTLLTLRKASWLILWMPAQIEKCTKFFWPGHDFHDLLAMIKCTEHWSPFFIKKMER